MLKSIIGLSFIASPLIALFFGSVEGAIALVILHCAITVYQTIKYVSLQSYSNNNNVPVNVNKFMFAEVVFYAATIYAFNITGITELAIFSAFYLCSAIAQYLIKGIRLVNLKTIIA